MLEDTWCTNHPPFWNRCIWMQGNARMMDPLSLQVPMMDDCTMTVEWSPTTDDWITLDHMTLEDHTTMFNHTTTVDTTKDSTTEDHTTMEVCMTTADTPPSNTMQQWQWLRVPVLMDLHLTIAPTMLLARWSNAASNLVIALVGGISLGHPISSEN